MVACMTTTADTVSELRFSHPPVRRVDLTLTFKPRAHIQTSYLASLISSWSSNLPVVDELPPKPVEPSDRTVFLSERSKWPLPFMRFSSTSGDITIAFQGNLFEISWKFSPGQNERYPGFAHLTGQLKMRFSEFQEALEKAGVELEMTGSECRYTNEMEGLSSSDLAVGILTNWQGSPDVALPDDGYVGMRIHACPDEGIHKCTTWVAVDGSVREDATLTISVERSVGEEELDLAGLREAHDELIRVFLERTPTHLHEKWGRIQ